MGRKKKYLPRFVWPLPFFPICAHSDQRKKPPVIQLFQEFDVFAEFGIRCKQKGPQGAI